MVNRKDLIYKTENNINSFQQFETIKYFAKNIFNGKITLNNADKGESNLWIEIMNFKKNPKPKNPEKKSPPKNMLESYVLFLMVEKRFLQESLKVN